jgi:hypothetical protein
VRTRQDEYCAISQRTELCFVEVCGSSSRCWRDRGRFALIFRTHGAARIRSWTTGLLARRHKRQVRAMVMKALPVCSRGSSQASGPNGKDRLTYTSSTSLGSRGRQRRRLIDAHCNLDRAPVPHYLAAIVTGTSSEPARLAARSTTTIRSAKLPAGRSSATRAGILRAISCAYCSVFRFNSTPRSK